MSTETVVATSVSPAESLSQQSPAVTREQTVFAILAALSLSHLLNDMMQSLIPAIYPVLKDNVRPRRSTQIGLITFTFQVTASLLQPLVGIVTDRRPMPYSLAMGMAFTLVGLLLLSVAGQLHRDPRGGGAGRHRLVGVPPRGVARGAAGVRRAARVRPVAVPGRRQRRHGARAAAGGVHRRAARAGEHRLVLARRAAGDVRAVRRRPLVPDHLAELAARPQTRRPAVRPALSPAARGVVASRSCWC